ncbi:MAG TPA: hypothetical protein DEB39_11985 [Planctomycetaceae bacterium]|nr:hypothetical protein [Planctomycetaceae bacterium]
MRNRRRGKPMSDVVLFGRDLAMRTKTHVERTPVASPLRNKNRIGVAADLFSPVVLVGGWEKIIENGGENGGENSAESGWVARCRRLWQDATTGKYDPADWNPEVSELYDPTADGEPASLPGDRVWAVYRGRWEVVSSPGGGAPAAPVLYGTIMEDVPPTDHSDVDYRFGKVSVLGKTYRPTDSNESVNDGNPIVYDYCVCLETSFESDEYLIQNTFVKLTGPYKMDDPDADPESEEPPDQVDFYVAVEIDREYIAEIDSDIYKSTDSTIQVGGHSFKVFGDLIPPDSYIPAGFGVRVRRTTGTTVPRLCVIAGKCPAKIQEEQ